MKKACAIAAIYLLSAAKVYSAETLTPVKLLHNSTSEGRMAPYAYGIKKGIFKAEGIDLTFLDGKGSAAALKAVVDDEVRFAIVDANLFAKGVSEGQPAKMISGQLPINPFAVISLTTSGIKSVKSLAGKKIGISKGAATTLLFPAFLAANGMKLSDVTLIEVDGAKRSEMLVDGSVDALLWFYLNAPTQEHLMKKPIAALRFSNYGLPLPGEGLVVNTKHLSSDADKDLNCRFVRASAKAWKATENNMAEAADAMREMFPKTDNGFKDATLEQLRRLFELVNVRKSTGKPFGYIFAEDWGRLQDVLKTHEVIKKELPVEKYITNDFSNCSEPL